MKNLNKMKIAGDMQFEIGQDKVSHFPDLSIKDDNTLYKKLDNMRHSTFDLSKFEVVGSPVITDDGIASGLNHSNYLTIPLNISGSDNIDLEIEWQVDETDWSDAKIVLGGINNINNGTFQIYHYATACYVSIFINIDDTATIKLVGFPYNVNEKGTYKIHYQKSNTTHTVTLFKPNGTSDTIEYTGATGYDLYISDTQRIGYYTNTNTSINLKQISLLQNGKEVFSGNKTGIDAIKPDDYTIVGNPVITDDGVVSGFNANNTMTLPVNQSNLSEFILHFKGKFVAGENNRNIIFTNEQNKGVGKTCLNNIDIQWAEKRIGVTLYIDNVWTSLVTLPTPALNLNDTVEITLTLGMTEQHLKVVLNDTTEYNSTLHLELSPFSIVNPTLSPTSFPWFGNIDLNSIRMYGDGDLIYQPCLKIPYTESKTGSKIVDEVYRDRVIDLYEQQGYTHYYTIGENDFTLATCKGSDVVAQGEAEGIAYTKTADLTLTQRGNCTSESVVNLLPYKDENSYHVSAPYTDKTSNSFTPSVDGDFIAVGKCYL